MGGARVASDAAGGFVTASVEVVNHRGVAVSAGQYDASGNARGNELRVNTVTADGTQADAARWGWTPTATSSSSGRATYQDGSLGGVYARR